MPCSLATILHVSEFRKRSSSKHEHLQKSVNGMVHGVQFARRAYPQDDPIGQESFKRDTHCATGALTTGLATLSLRSRALHILNKLSQIIGGAGARRWKVVVSRETGKPPTWVRHKERAKRSTTPAHQRGFLADINHYAPYIDSHRRSTPFYASHQLHEQAKS